MREMPQDRQEPMSPHIAQEPIVAVVVPCYNEEAVLEHTHKALSHKLASLIDSRSISAQSFICYVDDGSRDRTWEILCDLVDSKETSANAERYPLFSKEATLCHADFQSARNDAKTQNLNNSAQDSKIAELESGLLDSRQICSRWDLSFSRSAWDSRIVDEKGLLCERSQGRILGVCNCSEREAIKPLSLQAESINSSPPPPVTKDRVRTKALKLSRNVGHQNALLAGLDFVGQQCACAISIDADLQDDIGVFDEFIKAFKQGKEVVYGVRKSRDTDTMFKRKSAQGFYEVMAFLGVRIVYNHADYRLLSARAIAALASFKEVNLFLRGIVPLLGFPSGVVRYDRLERVAGESKYPLRKMLSFAWNGITSFSIVPLRLVSVVGFVFFLLSVLFGGYVLCVRLFTDWAVYGWASTLIPLSFFSGIQLLSLGVIGEYIGKIYQESKARPRYFVEEAI
ncbi:glycosyltransferase [Helicobacter canis]|uniref:Glycosyltransferase 2-like domain-containing protein n=1 Tax=Helicobacter canis NCTC 12740 TaxID=1357399 RepID=V8CKE2_9HELI|nr:glycosyltransferase [Helicobacter canis]ETD27226.1 hypothetical protein HMPREF2087_00134 [Helicobacter canis NCTC 12740]